MFCKLKTSSYYTHVNVMIIDQKGVWEAPLCVCTLQYFTSAQNSPLLSWVVTKCYVKQWAVWPQDTWDRTQEEQQMNG